MNLVLSKLLNRTWIDTRNWEELVVSLPRSPHPRYYLALATRVSQRFWDASSRNLAWKRRLECLFDPSLLPVHR